MPLIVGLVTECESISEKLKVCLVDIGSGSVSIVTNAPNIRVGSRTVVAKTGTELEIDGQTVKVEKRAVGGRKSEGMICDSKMCNWKGGAQGIAVQIPDEIGVGESCPSSKPRGGDAASADVQPAEIRLAN